MELPYPLNTIWYVEAHDHNGLIVSTGSAVAIRLQCKLSESEGAQTFLLTCTHVVRGKSSDHKKGFGPVLESIKVWPPGEGYDDDQGIKAEVFSAARDVDAAEVPADRRANASEDWVVLRLDSSEHRMSADAASWASQITSGQPVSVFGFPDGKGSFVKNNVVATKSPEAFTVRDENRGVVQLNGTATKEGMSGGGVFDAKGRLISLHRAKYDAALQVHGISSPKLRQWLDEKDWEVISPDRQLFRKPSLLWLKIGVVAFVLALIGFVLSQYRTPTPESTTQVARVKLKASLLSINERGFPTNRVPLKASTITIQPANFEALNLTSMPTDEQGNSIVEIEHAALQNGTQLKGHFLVTEVPAELLSDSPYATTEYGAVLEGEGLRYLRKTPRTIVDGEEIELNIVPAEHIPRFYIPSIVPSFATTDAVATAAGQSSLISDLESNVATTTLNTWVEILRSERPILGLQSLESSADEKWGRLKPLVEKADSVCYVSVLNSAEGTFYSSGFVVAEDTVIVVSYSANDKYDRVGFGNSADSTDDQTFAVSGILHRSNELQIAILDVPGIDRLPLSMESSNPYSDQSVDIAVVGYPVVDARLPREVNELFLNDNDRKKIMPGRFNGLQSNPDATASSRAILIHNATTSGGAGGAPVFDVASGRVVGVHTAGQWMGDGKLNQAIPTWALMEDDAIRAILKERGLVVSRNSTTSRIVEQSAGYDPSFLVGGELPLPTPKHLPTQPSLDDLTFHYAHFTVVMNPQESLAWYTACNIDGKSLMSLPRAGLNFVADPRCPPIFQRTSTYYSNNEWDRGNLVQRSAVLWGSAEEAKEANQDAFFYTNITPQHNNFNQSGRGGLWGRLENQILEEVTTGKKRATIFAGPIFSETDPMYRGYRIPKAFWKIAVIQADNGTRQTTSWILPQLEVTRDGISIPLDQGNRTLDSCKATVKQIESATNLLFPFLD